MRARYAKGKWQSFVNGEWIDQEPESKFKGIAESGKPPRMDVGKDFAWDQENGGLGHKCEQVPGMYASSKADLKDKLARAGYTYEE